LRKLTAMPVCRHPRVRVEAINDAPAEMTAGAGDEDHAGFSFLWLTRVLADDG
jgi:hypothetical protein